jgi:phage terminase large subunit-like protein
MGMTRSTTTSRSTSRRKILRHSKQTEPQRKFWASQARFRLFAGGVGSGKTRASCVEALRMPRGSTGMMVAPTYPMLRDATLRTFFELVQPAGILRRFNRSEMRAELAGDRTILFRSGEKPDRLRGPNLGWFLLDEAAMLDVSVWLIMMGRLRQDPAVAWAATTPRGRNWVYQTFVGAGPDYDVIHASSRTNQFLPRHFIRTLEDAYDPTFAAQEIEGEFLAETLGQLLPDYWIDRLPELVRPNRSGGPRWLACDLGEGGGRDSTVLMVGDALGILYCEDSAWMGPVQAAHRIAELVRGWDVRQDRVVYDAGGGRGLDIEPYLEQHGITDAIAYKGNREGGSSFLNLRSKVAWRLRQRLDPERPKPPPPLVYDPHKKPSVFDDVIVPTAEPQPPFTLPAQRGWWPRLEQELKALFFEHKGKKIALEAKDLLAKRIKRSPDVLDALLMSFVLDHE